MTRGPNCRSCCSYWTLLLLVINFTICVLGPPAAASATEAQDEKESVQSLLHSLEAKYEQRFERFCPKFPFVRKYEEMLRNPPDRYMIFVYEEGDGADREKYSKGGLGDRLAGLVTAFAWAMRTRRTFLLQGDAGLQTYFKPRVVLKRKSGSGEAEEEAKELNPQDFSWSNWTWAGWKEEYNHGSQHVVEMQCVNPVRVTTPVCSLDWGFYENEKIIRYRSNRTYLCRWMANIPDLLKIQPELLETLGITRETNLYEVAGCLLRMVLHPTKQLWKAVGNVYISHKLNSVSLKTPDEVIQVGTHFRCGDLTAFDHVKESREKCIAAENGSFAGLNFLDDFSPDSPLDLVRCASSISPENATLFVASDNLISAKQITTFKSWSQIVHPSGACHIDLHAANNPSCGFHTLVQWFYLAQSDAIITQSLHRNPLSHTYDRPSIIEYLQQGYSDPFAPISAFSRFAVIYGLSFNELRYGKDCAPVNTTTLGHYSHGNWLCYPIDFF